MVTLQSPLQATGSETTICTNPRGNVAPGQNKTPLSPTAQVTVPSTQIKNGTVSVCLATQPPPAPSATEVGCPNGNWTASINDVSFTNATVTVVQGAQVVPTGTFKL